MSKAQKPRSSSPNMTGGTQRAASDLSYAIFKTAGRTIAEDAQKKIEERHAKRAAEVPRIKLPSAASAKRAKR